MLLRALILDVDGTLLDSNRLHARSWADVLSAHGHRCTADEVLLKIGMGGDKLLPQLVPGLDEERARALRDEIGRAFQALAQAEGVKPLPGAEALIPAARHHHLRTAIATSGKKKDFQALLRISGLDLEKAVDAVVTADEVDASKPDPDLVAVAIQQLGLTPASCAMVGDTPFDMEAAVRAGALPIGVLTGVHPEEAMRRAGARELFRDVGALAEALGRLVH